MEEKNCLSKNPHSAKISFRNEGKVKTLSEEGTLRELATSRPTVKGWVKEFSKQKRNDERRNLGTLGRKNMVYKNMGE